MWASVTSSSEETIEPDYTSIEQLFCFPQTSPKEKATAPVKAEPKEVLGYFYLFDKYRSRSLHMAPLTQSVIS